MDFMPRTLTTHLRDSSSHMLALITGPRQSGKTTLVRVLLEKAGSYRFITLDDLQTRILANNDPRLLLGDIDTPLLVDEAQYAPQLFPELKRQIDEARFAGKALPPIYITGSNQIDVNKHIRESLAGRAERFTLFPLSVAELHAVNYFNRSIFLRGGWPLLYRDPTLDPVNYLNDYIKSFLEKDIALMSGVRKLSAFEQFIKLLSARTAQVLNLSDLAGTVGVQVSTLSDWLSLLEQNGIIINIPAYSSNLTKRVLKSPKLHFLDIGLAARLQGWTAIDPLCLSPVIGHLFESLVCGELIKLKEHSKVNIEIFHFRNKQKEEIDFVIALQAKSGILWIAIEAKFAAQSAKGRRLPQSLEKTQAHWHNWIVTFSGERRTLQHETLQLPLVELAATLETLAKN